jgi:Transposase DDE domain group 1
VIDSDWTVGRDYASALCICILRASTSRMGRFYNKRGTAAQWIKEGKQQAVKMTRLSCHRFRSNQVGLALSMLAYNLGNLWRRLALPKRIENWSLTKVCSNGW